MIKIITLDEKKLKDMILYFQFKNDEKESDNLGSLELGLSHKIELLDNDTKFYLIIEYMSFDIKGDRDVWYEILKNSRRTAKEISMSATKHPRNIDLLSHFFVKGEEQFKEKMDNEIKEIAL